MKRLLCWLDGFVETWLDPGMWRLGFLGNVVTCDGHLHDLDNRWFEIEDGREKEYTRCSRCRSVLLENVRPMP